MLTVANSYSLGPYTSHNAFFIGFVLRELVHDKETTFLQTDDISVL